MPRSDLPNLGQVRTMELEGSFIQLNKIPVR